MLCERSLHSRHAILGAYRMETAYLGCRVLHGNLKFIMRQHSLFPHRPLYNDMRPRLPLAGLIKLRSGVSALSTAPSLLDHLRGVLVEIL
jgi:hypothetical protein